MTMKQEFTAHDMATAAADGFRDGQRASAELATTLSRSMSEVINGVPRELLLTLCMEREGERWTDAMIRLQALLSEQPQASAGQSAPEGEREAVAYVLTRDGEVCYEADDGIVISNTPGDETDLWKWQPVYFGAAQQRTQAAGVPDAWRDLLRRARRFVEDWDDDSQEFMDLCGEIDNALAAAPAQPAAPDRVSVPVELLQDLHDLASDAVEHHRAAFAGYKLKRQANMEHVVGKAHDILSSFRQEVEK